MCGGGRCERGGGEGRGGANEGVLCDGSLCANIQGSTFAISPGVQLGYIRSLGGFKVEHDVLALLSL